jgi:hypothetical protein
MRTAQVLGGAVLLLVLGGSIHAEPVANATVAVPEAEARSGPSSRYYPTNRLRLGDRVSVLHDEADGWVAIVPPADSFSWVRADLVTQYGRWAMVEAAEAPVLVGSKLYDHPPTVEQLKVKRGTVFVVIGRPQSSADGTLLPVAPAPAEVRYVPAAALRRDTPGQLVVSTSTPAGPSFTQPTLPAIQPGVNPLWSEAEKAERAGNLVEARRLYEQLANQVSLSDRELAVRCLNRAEYLRTHDRPAAIAGTTAAYPGAPRADGQLVSTPSAQYAQNGSPYPPRGAMSQYCYTPDTPAASARLTPPDVNQATAPAAAPAQWYGPGRLYQTGYRVDGKPTYGLEASNGQWRFYVAAAPSVNLESYLGRNLLVYGSMGYRGELRAYYMTALQVSPQP